MSDRVLVTGASGYLGVRCVEALVDAGTREVMALWRANSDRVPAHLPGVVVGRCDLADAAAVDAVVRQWQPTAIVHAAALLPDGQPDYVRRAIAANVLGTANIVAAARAVGCSRLVYCSSISVYGSAPCPADGWCEDTLGVPASPYGWSKYAGEEVLRLQCDGLNAVGLRFAGIHGGSRRGGALFHMIGAALSNQAVALDHPADPFQVLFVDDAAAAVVGAVRASLPGGYHPVNVASHVFSSMDNLAHEIVDLCRSASAIELRHAGGRGAQVMNTSRMRSSLGLIPGSATGKLAAMISDLTQDCLGTT